MSKIFKLDDGNKTEVVSQYIMTGLLNDIQRRIKAAKMRGYRYCILCRYENDKVIDTINLQTKEVRVRVSKMLVEYYITLGIDVVIREADDDFVGALVIKW